MPIDNSIAGKDPSQIPAHLTGAGALCGSALATQPSQSSSCVEFAALEGSREGSDDGMTGVSATSGDRTPGGDDIEAGTMGNGGAHLVSLGCFWFGIVQFLLILLLSLSSIEHSMNFVFMMDLYESK